MKLDIKSVAIGVLCSFTLMLAFGYSSTTGDNLFVRSAITWALVVPQNGKVLARAYDGKAFIIDVDSSKATKVEYDKTKISVMTEQILLSGID